MILQTLWGRTVSSFVDLERSAVPRPSHHRVPKRRLCILLASAVAACFALGSPIAASGEMSIHHVRGSAPVIEPADPTPRAHAEVLAAGFGFQAAGASVIMVRTYDALTGVVLTDDSFDVSVKEEGGVEVEAKNGRIFAGGIGVDPSGNSKFMLSVYDAESGRFLWEGQLNLLKVDDEGVSQVKASITPIRPAVLQVASSSPVAFDTIFSLRAVNPVTGSLVWQDQFAPGSRRRGRAERVSLSASLLKPTNNPIAHIFDLIVRTYDQRSGRLLWEDSFEQLDQIEESSGRPDTDSQPQSIPFRRSLDGSAATAFKAVLR